HAGAALTVRIDDARTVVPETVHAIFTRVRPSIAVFLEAARRWRILVVSHEVTADRVSPFEVPEGLPEVQRGGPAVGGVIVHVIVLEGKGVHPEGEEHATAAAGSQFAVAHGDVPEITVRISERHGVV